MKASICLACHHGNHESQLPGGQSCDCPCHGGPTPTAEDMQWATRALMAAEQCMTFEDRIRRANDHAADIRELRAQLENARAVGKDWEGKYFAAHDEVVHLRQQLQNQRRDWPVFIFGLLVAIVVLCWIEAR